MHSYAGTSQMSNISFKEFLADAVLKKRDQQNLSLKLVEFGKKLPLDREVWFSSKAILTKDDKFDSIDDATKQQKKIKIEEEVNDKIFYTDFKKEKEILDGKYKLVATCGWVKMNAKPAHKSEQFRIVAKTAGGTECGWVNFEKHGDHLEALDLSVQPAHRRKGIATEMYKLARECGNDVAPSKLQTGMGKTFWNKDHSK
jgi:GNAT superfamily N-acetyltransferase